jgi:hypothetical protein
VSLEDSPKLSNYDRGLPIRSPNGNKRRLLFRWILITLTVLIFTFGIVQVQNSDAFARLAGEGSVVGRVIDHQGDPYPAEVVISGTKISSTADNTGYFEISHIPKGEYAVFFLNDLYGWEQALVIDRGQKTNMGTVTIPYIEVAAADLE